MSELNTEEETASGSDTGEFAQELQDNSSETVAILGHFYRGEMERTVGWRTRLDQTTNWAVVLMAAILTFSFSSEDNPHYVLLIGVLGVVAFLVIESQRYQEYDAWRHRVRLLQRHFFADVTDPDGSSDSDWKEQLSDDLREPTLVIPRWRALGHRLKRVYLLLLTVLIASWLLRITVFEGDGTVLETASIGSLPGIGVIAVVGGLYLLLAVLALWSAVAERMREFKDESIPFFD